MFKGILGTQKNETECVVYNFFSFTFVETDFLHGYYTHEETKHVFKEKRFKFQREMESFQITLSSTTLLPSQ